MKLTGKNFQAHESFSLDMTGLTVLIGPSNEGKSAIFRAVKALLRNELGANHVRTGTDGLELTAEIDGHIVQAKRSKKGTVTYRVDGQDFAKLNSAIPKPLQDLGINPISIGDTTLDPIFARQSEKQFLLEETPATLNAILGAFSATEKLEQGKREANSRVTTRNAEGKSLAADIQELETLRAEVERLSGAAKDVAVALAEWEPGLATKEREITQLDALSTARTRQTAVQSITDRLEIPDVTPMVALQAGMEELSRLIEAKQRHSRLTSLLHSLAVPDTKGMETTLAVVRYAAVAATTRSRTVQLQACLDQIESALSNWPVIVAGYKPIKAIQDLIDIREAPGALQLKTRAEKLNTIVGELEAGIDTANNARKTVAWVVGYLDRTEEYMRQTAAITDIGNEIDLLEVKLAKVTSDHHAAEAAKASMVKCPKCGEEFDCSHQLKKKKA